MCLKAANYQKRGTQSETCTGNTLSLVVGEINWLIIGWENYLSSSPAAAFAELPCVVLVLGF